MPHAERKTIPGLDVRAKSAAESSRTLLKSRTLSLRTVVVGPALLAPTGTTIPQSTCLIVSRYSSAVGRMGEEKACGDLMTELGM